MTQTPDRRLVVRVHAVWSKIAGTQMPRRSQVDPREFGGDWANCLLIDLDPAPGRSRFSHVGENLRDPTWPTFDRQCVSECLEGSLLELVTRHIPKLTAKRKPISFGGAATHDEVEILYRTTLLPLSETGDKVDGVLAAVAYREVAVAHELSPADSVPELARAKARPATAGNGHTDT
jgi:hypothetical protein